MCQNADSARSHHRERLIQAQAAGGYLSLSLTPLTCMFSCGRREAWWGTVNHAEGGSCPAGASLITWESVSREEAETNVPDLEKKK